METVSKPSRHRRTAEEIRMIVEEFRASGQTMSAFCQQHGIPRNSLSRWADRDQLPHGNNPSGFAVLQVNGSTGSLLAEVHGIRSYQPVSATFLKELVA